LGWRKLHQTPQVGRRRRLILLLTRCCNCTSKNNFELVPRSIFKFASLKPKTCVLLCSSRSIQFIKQQQGWANKAGAKSNGACIRLVVCIYLREGAKSSKHIKSNPRFAPGADLDTHLLLNRENNSATVSFSHTYLGLGKTVILWWS